MRYHFCRWIILLYDVERRIPILTTGLYESKPGTAVLRRLQESTGWQVLEVRKIDIRGHYDETRFQIPATLGNSFTPRPDISSTRPSTSPYVSFVPRNVRPTVTQQGRTPSRSSLTGQNPPVGASRNPETLPESPRIRVSTTNSPRGSVQGVRLTQNTPGDLENSRLPNDGTLQSGDRADEPADPAVWQRRPYWR